MHKIIIILYIHVQCKLDAIVIKFLTHTHTHIHTHTHTQFFGFLTMFWLIGLAVFVALGAFLFNWGPTKAKYTTS